MFQDLLSPPEQPHPARVPTSSHSDGPLLSAARGITVLPSTLNRSFTIFYFCGSYLTTLARLCHLWLHLWPDMRMIPNHLTFCTAVATRRYQYSA